MAKSFVGVDVSKAKLDIKVLPSGLTKRVANDPEGHRELVEFLRPHAADGLRAILESTGGFELEAALALEAAGFEVAIVRPERVKYFAKSEGHRAKTDAIDAHVLARFAATATVEIHPLPTAEVRAFREILDRRQQLVTMRTMETNRRDSTAEGPALKNLEKHIEWLNKSIKAIEKDLDARIEACTEWKATSDVLQSTPGVGPQTARTVIAQLPELGQVSHKRIAHLVGLAPMACDSGTIEKPRHIVGGRQQVRDGLYMATVSAIRCNPIIKAYYAHLRSRGKAAKVAMIAAARKLLTMLNAMVRDRVEWRHLPVAAQKA